MERNFNFTPAGDPKPIVFEEVFAEKPGGGLISNPSYEIPESTALGENSAGLFVPIKAYRLVEAVTTDATTIKIAKGSGIQKGDIIAHGKVGVACTGVDTATSDECDIVTVTLGIAIDADVVLYQAAEASADAAAPVYTPKYVLGDVLGGTVPANQGDVEVRLINGANIRKETANIADEVAALLPLITLV
jgi:hypothetical protein